MIEDDNDVNKKAYKEYRKFACVGREGDYCTFKDKNLIAGVR